LNLSKSIKMRIETLNLSKSKSIKMQIETLNLSKSVNCSLSYTKYLLASFNPFTIIICVIISVINPIQLDPHHMKVIYKPLFFYIIIKQFIKEP
jgi:hypothetical protein